MHSLLLCLIFAFTNEFVNWHNLLSFCCAASFLFEQVNFCVVDPAWLFQWPQDLFWILSLELLWIVLHLNSIVHRSEIWAHVFWWQVVKLVRAIRNGWIKFDKPKEEPNLYLLWGDETDTTDNKRQGLSYNPAPKPNLPGIFHSFFRISHFYNNVSEIVRTCFHWVFIYILKFLLFLYGEYQVTKSHIILLLNTFPHKRK